MEANTLMSSAAQKAKAAAKPHATDLTKHAAAISVKKAQKVLAKAASAAKAAKKSSIAGALKVSEATRAMKARLHKAVRKALKSATAKLKGAGELGKLRKAKKDVQKSTEPK